MKANDRIFADIHVLQTVPPSCINRDDTGSPKTAVYGGVTRARVSSQCWKHAVRKMFGDSLPEEKLGKRTKKIVGLVADEIRKLDGTIDAETAAQKLLESAGLKIKSVEKGTDALFFMSIAQARELAKLAVGKSNPSQKEAHNALRQYPSIDVALFGRMVADDPTLNTDACAQVAHSISTHKVSNEYDYFTAVDDLSPADSAGAGHIGTVEFNSATLYRYATVAVHELYKQLGDDTADAMEEFIRAFVCAMPTGKQNTFANRTLPDAVLVTLRTDQPINLAGAFEKPVPAGGEGYVAASAKQLIFHAKSVYQNYGGEPVLSIANSDLLSGLGDIYPLNMLLDKLADELRCYIGNDGDIK